MRSIILLTALLTALLVAKVITAFGVSAQWNINTQLANVTITYTQDVDINASKNVIQGPGDKIELTVAPGNGRLTIHIRFSNDVPYVGGKEFSIPIDVRPGQNYTTDFDIIFGVKLKVYGMVKILATIEAEGAEPSRASGELPLRAEFTARGAPNFTIRLVAQPYIGLELTAFGITLFSHEQALDEKELAPPIRYQVKMQPPAPTQPAGGGPQPPVDVYRQLGTTPTYTASDHRGGFSQLYNIIAVAVIITAALIAAALIASRLRAEPTTPTYSYRTHGATGQSPLAYLVLHTGGYIPIYTYERVFGRRDFSAMLPPDSARYISTRHFRIFYAGGQWYIEDLGSTNGTFVDGADIRGRGPVPLRPGAVISLAGVVNIAFSPAS